MGMAVGPPDVASGTGTIIYCDGTTQTYTLTFPDWFTDGVGGAPADQLVGSGTLSSVNGDIQGHPVGLYAAELPLEGGQDSRVRRTTRHRRAAHLRDEHRLRVLGGPRTQSHDGGL